MPFTFAPTQRWPTSVWIEYAKSSGVEPAARFFTSPFGVKTKTSSSKRSTLSASRKAFGPWSRSFSISWRSQVIFSLLGSPEEVPSL